MTVVEGQEGALRTEVVKDSLHETEGKGVKINKRRQEIERGKTLSIISI